MSAMTSTKTRRLGSLAIVGLLGVHAAAFAAGQPDPQAGLATAMSSASEVSGSKPNIVVVMTDDMRQDDLRVLPRVRELIGGHGTTFVNSFVSSPVCAPSRAGYFTGGLPHNTEVPSQDEGRFQAMDFSNALGVWLQDAGYFTSHIGKQINGYGVTTPPGEVTGSGDVWTGATYVPPGFDDWFGLLDPSTNTYFDYLVNDNGEIRAFTGPDNYKSDVLAERAVEVIETLEGNSQPLFMTVAPNTPHDEAAWIQQDPASEGVLARDDPDPAPRYVGSFADEPLPRPPSFNEGDVADKPEEVRSRPPMSDEEIEATTANYRARLASLLAIDDNVAAIYDALSQTGRLDNTIFVFTSDNGWTLGEQRYSRGKVVHYEPSSRVPLLIRGPGFPAGVERRQPVSNIDLTATFVDVAGAQAGRPLDGQSLLLFAANPGYGLDRLVAFEMDANEPSGISTVVRPLLDENASEPTTHYSAVRARDWKYVLHTDTGEEELYHIKEDPYELNNLVLEQDFAAVLETLRAEQTAISSCGGQTCHRSVELREP